MLILRNEKGQFLKGVRVPTRRNISNRIEKKCEFCNLHFSIKGSQFWIKTCSQSCGAKLRTKKFGSSFKGKKASIETKEKQRKAKLGIRGPNHWNWKNADKSERSRAMTRDEYIQWRKNVFIRDNFTCQKCFKVKTYIQAHHIEPWAKNKDLRYDINNGKTLCVACHKEEHKKLKYLYKLR